MFLVHCEGNVRLTRSVKSIYNDWSEHLGLYRSLVVQPWQLAGTLGNRIDPSGGIKSTPEAVVPIDDEVGDDVDSEAEEVVPVEVIPIPSGMKPPPMFAAIAAEVAVFTEGIAPLPGRVQQDRVDATDVAMTGESTTNEEGTLEPSSKRQKLSVMGVGDETLYHVDLEPHELYEEVVDSESSDVFWNDDFWNSETEYDEIVHSEMSSAALKFDDAGSLGRESSVWQPYPEAQPGIQGEELAAIDFEADKIEIDRLQQTGVITTVDKYSGDLDTPLSAKMVRTWRKKQREEKGEKGQVVSTTAWLRRSRLVGRDFNFLEYREDVYSPASSAAIVKVLPAMAVTENGVLATLDVADAFLQVPQRVPRKTSLDGSEYIILKCLPGQRDASRLWYAFFIERLRAHMDISICPEQPCILKCGDKGALLLHVDDVLILAEGVQAHLHFGEKAHWGHA